MLRGTGLNYTADSMARNTAACKADAATATAAETGTGAVINHVSRRILSSEQQHHQFVKRYARFRMRCSRCGHHKLIQVVEIVSPPIYAGDVITAYPIYNYDYCQWCHYKKVETLRDN